MPYYLGGEITDRKALSVQTPTSLKNRLNLDVRVKSGEPCNRLAINQIFDVREIPLLNIACVPFQRLRKSIERPSLSPFGRSARTA